MKTKNKQEKRVNLKNRGLINQVNIQFLVSQKTLCSIQNMSEELGCSIDDIISIALNNYTKGFNKPKKAINK